MAVLESGSDRITNRVLQWVTWADRDYLASRRLLLDGLLAQGAGLANTAIEKYLKTVILIGGLGQLWEHDLPSIYSRLTSNEIDLHLNLEFLALLTKAYDLRYPDNLKRGFNIHLGQAKIIAALDDSVRRIRDGFNFTSLIGKRVETWFDVLVKKGDETLMAYNSAYGTAQREVLFRERTMCYELRVLDDDTILEAEYRTNEIKDDGKFDVPALVPGRPTSSQQTSL